MSMTSIIFLCFAFFALGVQMTGPIILPDQFDHKPFEYLGWLFFIAAVICWEIGR